MKKSIPGLAVITVLGLAVAPLSAARAQSDLSLQPTGNSLIQSTPSRHRTIRSHHARHAGAAQSAVSSDRAAPRSLESQEAAPPPPDGYEPVEDFDETLSAHSDAVLAVKPTSTSAPIEAQQVPRMASSSARQFDVFGVPVRVEAPVTPPYNASFTYETYGGQPGKGRDATGAWGAAGQP